ncbi:Oxidoreductase, short chain dehydrogenase/reductase family [Caenispirillum salinarum AK4]|uniref:Oxidoreductase, short chain dehydrogenase/reductase family n=1 Tax=Caenispirillum salinarum AK4 TaxID=1238182 RepID=K9HFI1_9PROT|nr:SDR family oxidoreductase [Caenispirillum salinarum]EKV29168.1 Oxidoreductase, short chain dehydrogenase/reductase family [Caenispirillum salinarum AK4]
MTDPLPKVLVTGGARGIGRGVCERLLDDGWHVVMLDADATALETMAERLAGRGMLTAVACDVADEAQVAAAVARADELPGPLKGLVNNAGIMHRQPVTELSLADWRRVIDTNLTGAFLLAKHAAPVMRADGGGAIVNMASTRAHMSEPDTESYAASKGGLVALTHALAISLGPDVRVNAVSPGWIDVSAWRADPDAAPEDLTHEDHAQHPAGRVGRPEDVAELVAYLLEDRSGFVTGSEFVIDSGMTRKMIYAE